MVSPAVSGKAEASGELNRAIDDRLTINLKSDYFATMPSQE